MGFEDRADVIRRGGRILVDGPHHSQRRTVKRFRSQFPGLVELHVDVRTGEPVDTYDATVSSAGTATWVYLPPPPPGAGSFGAAVPRP